MKQVGLVLEGGGLRGTYTSGVLDAFMKHQIWFEYIIGVSAGICNAVSYVSRQPGRSTLININHCDDKEYYSFGNLLKTGAIFNEKMLFDKIPHELYPFDYETYQKCYRKLLAGVTNCATGKAEYYELNDLRNQYDIVKASSWLPFVSKMVDYDGKKFLDGGIADSIPIQKSIADGNQKNVVVLTQPKGFRKTKSSEYKLSYLLYRNYPNLIDTLMNRYQTYNDTLDVIEQLEQQGKVFVIRPSQDLGLSRLEKDREKIRRASDLGLKDTEAVLSQMMDFITDSLT